MNKSKLTYGVRTALQSLLTGTLSTLEARTPSSVIGPQTAALLQDKTETETDTETKQNKTK